MANNNKGETMTITRQQLTDLAVYMDDTVRDELHSTVGDASPSAFWAAYVARVGADTAAEIAGLAGVALPASLRDLLPLMQADDPRLPGWDSLPTFGGAEPADTEGLWSWDATHQIQGTCSEDVEIVRRQDACCEHCIETLDSEDCGARTHSAVWVDVDGKTGKSSEICDACLDVGSPGGPGYRLKGVKATHFATVECGACGHKVRIALGLASAIACPCGQEIQLGDS